MLSRGLAAYEYVIAPINSSSSSSNNNKSYELHSRRQSSKGVEEAGLTLILSQGCPGCPSLGFYLREACILYCIRDMLVAQVALSHLFQIKNKFQSQTDTAKILYSEIRL